MTRSPEPAPDARARNPYLDALRVFAIAAVVTGHWLLVDIRYAGGRLTGRDALDHVPWGGWLTLVFQVLPVFFLVGGRVNAASWDRHRQDGRGWAGWVRTRAVRLLWPTTIYLLAVLAGVIAAAATNAPRAELAQAGWLLCLHLWFLPTYLLLVVLTPALLAAHRRLGLLVPAAMAGLAAVVDLAAERPLLLGLPNYLLVWGAMHQWGFAWQDGTWGRPAWSPYALAGAGAALFTALVALGPFPLDLIGTGPHRGNTSPPSIALLAFAAAQCGLVLAAEPAGARLLGRRPLLRTAVTRLDTAAMTTYLWHMVPVVALTVAVYPHVSVPGPVIGSGSWWALRAPWLATLALVLTVLTAVVTRLQRRLLGRSAARPSVLPATAWSTTRVAVGLAAAGAGLVRLAVGGAAPDGRPAVLTVTVYCAGMVLTTAAARRRRGDRAPTALLSEGR